MASVLRKMFVFSHKKCFTLIMYSIWDLFHPVLVVFEAVYTPGLHTFTCLRTMKVFKCRVPGSIRLPAGCESRAIHLVYTDGAISRRSEVDRTHPTYCLQCIAYPAHTTSPPFSQLPPTLPPHQPEASLVGRPELMWQHCAVRCEQVLKLSHTWYTRISVGRLWLRHV